MAQDHFQRHHHHPGVIDWNFNVTFDDQPSVAAMAKLYKPLLTRADMYDPIPVKWIHSTILRVGKLEDYTEEEMLEVAEIVQRRVRGIQLPVFHFGPCRILFGNICFPIEPEEELEKLYTAVTESLGSVVGPERASRSPYGRFISHTSLAYSKQRDNEDETAKILETADIEPATFQVTHMPLIKQKPINGHYEWEVVKDIVVG